MGHQNQGLLTSFADNHDTIATAPISGKMSNSIGPLILRRPAATSAINTATASPRTPTAFPKPANNHQAPPGSAWLSTEHRKPITGGASKIRTALCVGLAVLCGGWSDDSIMSVGLLF